METTSLLAYINNDYIRSAVPSLPSSLHTATALILASMTGETSLLTRASLDDEVILLLHALQSMGLKTEVKNGNIEVNSQNMGMRADSMNVGNSLVTFSLISALASNIPRHTTISGNLNPSVSIHHFVNALLSLGVNCEFPRESWSLPMNIRGPHSSHMTHITGYSPSIFISALTLGSLFSVHPTRIEVSPPVRAPILHPNDRDLMSSFGIRVETGETYIKLPGGQRCQSTSVRIPSDDVLNTFFICLGLMHGEIQITSVAHPPPIYDYLKRLKLDLSFNGDTLIARKSDVEISELNMEHHSDIAPLILTMATALPGTTRIEVDEKFLLPESRLNLLRTFTFLRKMGCDVLKNENTFFIPEINLQPYRLKADNYIIAFAQILASSSTNGSSISNIEVLLSRYPGITSELKSVGLTLDLREDDEQVFLLRDC